MENTFIEDEEVGYLSVIEFYRLFTEINTQDDPDKFFLIKFFHKLRRIKNAKQLIDIIAKIPNTRPLRVLDLREYLFFLNSTNLPNGDYGIITKSVDQSDIITNKKSIYAEFKFDYDEMDCAIHDYFKNKVSVYGNIILGEDIELKITVDNGIHRLNSHNILQKIAIKKFPDPKSVKTTAMIEAVEELNKRLVDDMINFLLDIIVNNIGDDIRKEIKKHAENSYR